LVVEQWAELRRLHFVDGVSVRELARRTGLHRKTVRRALGSADPPKYARPSAPSKLDPFKDEVHRLLKDEPRLPAVRIRELLQPLGYAGGETILKEHVREVRPFFLPTRTYQRTVYLPGELAQCDLWEPRDPIPVGFGQLRKGYVVTCALGYSKVSAGTLIFSKEAPDILAGLLRCLVRIGGRPKILVWDREGALHAGGGRPSDAFASFCGQLSVGWQFCAPADPEAKGIVERSHGFLETSFEPARHFAGPLDFQDQLDQWYAERANTRSTAASGLGRSSGSPKSSSGRCPHRSRTWTAGGWCGSRRSRTSGSTPLTIRSIRRSSAGGSSCGSRRARSARPRSTAASVSRGTCGPSAAIAR